MSKNTTGVKIDPLSIPASDYDTACRVLAASIRLALSDPANRADFERWKQERRAKNEKVKK